MEGVCSNGCRTVVTSVSKANVDTTALYIRTTWRLAESYQTTGRTLRHSRPAESCQSE